MTKRSTNFVSHKNGATEKSAEVVRLVSDNNNIICGFSRFSDDEEDTFDIQAVLLGEHELASKNTS